MRLPSPVRLFAPLRKAPTNAPGRFGEHAAGCKDECSS